MTYLQEIFSNISATDFLCAAAGIAAICASAFVAIKKVAAWHEKFVLQKNELKESQDASASLKKAVEDLTKSIDGINDSIQDIRTDIEEYKTSTQKEMDKIEKSVEATEEEKLSEHAKLNESISSINSTLNILIESDRSTILSYITNEYYKWHKIGYIPVYAMENLEDQFENYKKENGNHFAEDIMIKMRKLPNIVPGDNSYD